MDDCKLVRTHYTTRRKQQFFSHLRCSCGWTSSAPDRLAAQTEFFDHCYPYLSLEELVAKYATPPNPAPLVDLMDRYGIAIDPGADEP